jgi:hypothetical protein
LWHAQGPSACHVSSPVALRQAVRAGSVPRMKRLAGDARDGRRRCKVGFTFELRAVPLGIHAAIHHEHVGARRARLRRRTSNLVPVALVTSYSFTRSSCHHGPSWSKCGPGPVSCLQHCWRWRGSTPRWTWCVCRAALRCSSMLRCSEPPPTRTGWPNGLCEEPLRRGGADGAAGALNGRSWHWLTCWPSY